VEQYTDIRYDLLEISVNNTTHLVERYLILPVLAITI